MGHTLLEIYVKRQRKCIKSEHVMNGPATKERREVLEKVLEKYSQEFVRTKMQKVGCLVLNFVPG